MHYLTSREVSRLIGCTQRNIFHLVKAKKITPALTLENGHFLFTTEDVALYNSKKLNYAV